MNLLTDDEIDAVTTAQLGEQPLIMYTAHRAYARALEAATIKALAQGVNVEPEFKWCSVLQALPEENTYVMVCFGVDVVEGSYGSGLWLSLAYGEAQPDYWAYHPKPPHHRRDGSMYTRDQFTTAIAAAQAAALEEVVKVCDRQAIPNAGFLAEKARALINTNLTTGGMK